MEVKLLTNSFDFTSLLAKKERGWHAGYQLLI